MSDLELAVLIREAYDRYFLYKAQTKPESGFVYQGDVIRLIDWLEGVTDLVATDRNDTTDVANPQPKLKEEL